MFSAHPMQFAYRYCEEVMKKLNFYWMMYERLAAHADDHDFSYRSCGEDMWIESSDFTLFANIYIDNVGVRQAVADVRAFEPQF